MFIQYILHTGDRSSFRNLRTRHAMVTGTHLSWVCFWNHTKYINTFCRRNADFLNVTARGTHINRRTLQDSISFKCTPGCTILPASQVSLPCARHAV